MGNSIIRPVSLMVLFTITIGGCATSFTRNQNAPAPGTKYYSTAFPDRDISKNIEQIYRSVKKVISTGIYHTYHFKNELMTLKELKERGKPFIDLADQFIVHDESSVGTAISLDESPRNILLLTCAHVVDLPDTVITYNNDNKNLPKNTYVKSITVNIDQKNFIFDERNLASFNIIRSDRDIDLALINVPKKEPGQISAPPLKVIYGEPSDLVWGSFVYIFGYPKGLQMVTRGIVSSPNRTDKNDFLTDALFNRGVSGGLIIAVRGEIPNFEWVGVASSASATKEVILTPNPKTVHEYQRYDFYSDTAYVDIKSRINYGITQPISLTEVRRFLMASTPEIRKSGFAVKNLLK